jgi:hypothetical protein
MSQRQVMDMNMILADSDPVYTAILAARLQTKLPHVKISRCNDPAALRAAIAQQKTAGGPALFLYNAADFHELKHLSTADIWPASWQARPLLADRHWQGSTDDDPSDRRPLDLTSGFCRFDPVSSLVEQLQAQFDLAPEAMRPEESAPERLKSEASEPNASDPGTNDPKSPGRPKAEANQAPAANASENDIPVDRSGLRLLLSVAASGHDQVQTRQCLNDLVSQGHQVFYLPLMPTYQMTSLAQPAQGPNLSDLLMHLVGQEPGCEQIGRYCQQHPDGYFQFRPPDRTDDLILCPPDTLRLLIRKLRDYILRQPPVAVGLIDCAGLPLSTVAVAAVMCDVCQVSIPGGTGFAAEAARMEAGRLFAVLPATCKIWKTWLP